MKTVEVIVACMLSISSFAQEATLSNNIFEYSYESLFFSELDSFRLAELNSQFGKESWNRYIGGLSSKSGSTLLLFQILASSNLKVGSLDEFAELMRNEFQSRGLSPHDFQVVDSLQTVYTTSCRVNCTEYWMNYVVLTKFGAIYMKIVSGNDFLEREVTDDLFAQIVVNEKYVGLPEGLSLSNLKWGEILLRGITSALTPGIEIRTKTN